jgi:beta-galactosidase
MKKNTKKSSRNYKQKEVLEVKQVHNKYYLNQDWKYVEDYQESYKERFPTKCSKVSLPHTNKVLPFNYFDEKLYQFVSSYEHTFNLEKNKNKRYFLHFEGVMAYAEVYLNGENIGSHKGGYTPFSFEVTDHLQEENRLFVKVDSTERPDIPPHGFVVDYLTYGGIYREVYLEETPQNSIKHAFLDASPLGLRGRLVLDGSKKDKLLMRIKDQEELIKEQDFTFDFEREEVTFSIDVELDTWSIERPILYTLEILQQGEITYQSKFASRKVEWKEDGFYLNNKRIQLRGLNRHQSFPYVGYAMPSSMQKKDADILKYELGCNIVRSSHYPPSRYFLDRCDEIGLLVFNEIPGWQHIGDQAWQDLSVQHVKEMIIRDYNHPSIVIWGTRINESKDADAFYKRTHEMAKSLDPIRATGGVRNFKHSNLIEDVYTYNDFVHRGNNIGLEAPKKVRKVSSPYLVTEYNGHMYPTKTFDDENHRISQVKRHLNVQHTAYKEDHISGAIGWCMADYNTHKDFGSGDKICYHGVMDMFRIPKYASAVYRSQSDHELYMKVANNIQIGDFQASEIKDVLVLTNADSVRFYINQDYIGEFYPSKEYHALPHPPIIIDDFIGNLIHKHESFKDKDADKIKSVLLSIMHDGMKLPLKEKLKMMMVLLKYKMTIDEAAKLYEKYVGKWGMESLEYRFEAIKDGQVVAEEIHGPGKENHLELEIDTVNLKETTTYEVARVVIKHVDNHRHVLPYSREIVHVSCDGPIELIGPSTLVLQGGQTGLYVKTLHQKGQAKIHVKSERFGQQTLDLNVT